MTTKSSDRLTPLQKRFCEEYARCLLQTRAAIAAGYSERTARTQSSHLMTVPAVRVYIAELLEAQREALRLAGIANKMVRVAILNDAADRLRTVLAERADDPSFENVAGGTTGLLVRTYKAVEHEVVEEYAVDAGALRELRETLKQAAQELGDWTDKQELTGANNGPLVIERREPVDLSLLTDDELEAYQNLVRKGRAQSQSGTDVDADA